MQSAFPNYLFAGKVAVVAVVVAVEVGVAVMATSKVQHPPILTDFPY